MKKWANMLFIGYTVARFIIYYLFCRIFSHLYTVEDSTQFFNSLDFKISASILIICCLLYIAIVGIVYKYTITSEDYSFNPNLIDNVITGCIMVVGCFIAVFNLGNDTSMSLIGFSLLILGGIHFVIRAFGGNIWE